ncbi:serine/threonine-protein kinase [Lapillicoccus jejuensis]|uniref:non-specific serine/threonine protein kinase n=1 Tax=Lapillicoccus jejuensis TaxID=402171 RepID=A0A542DWT4_9MICO|nr:serine/threonine-protein kinase [Lapillicoccus jejuensis]TQJ07547.1 serine/threonine-protein kinase PknG [Lapillicoccus jejuensis]
MTTTTLRCTQPGCTGTILDGYCDVCGSPAPATPTAAPTAPASAGGCTQPGCPGTVVDGYCDVCGTPGAGGTSTAVPTATVGGSPGGASYPAGYGVDPDGDDGSGLPPARQQVITSDVPDGTPCPQPGCGGHLVDGFCDVCGSSAQAVPEPAGVASPGSTASRASNRLASTALGSVRARQTGSRATRRVGAGSQRMRSARLGAGLTTIPPVAAIDASTAVMDDPVVPEPKRFCSTCGTPVGRGHDGQPGRTTGFCPKCRQPFSFDPKLRPGDLVAGQYEVAGCLAHGGLGWVYLARDRNVSDRWVVLKGLLNSGDPDALAAAIAEQRFLAQVSHPHIVEIYNFVTHDDAGYIVMEYVGGTSLKSLLKQRMRKAGRYDPIPADQALAYVVEILPAFQYLHDLGLVYCDFKPDNLIQVGDDLKLIDLGGVRRIDDDESAIFGTVGYQAPEVAEQGTTVASDVYTIGRTLVVLMTEFRGYQSTYVASLPAVADTPLFQRYDSLHRLLAKACAPSPDDRFASADELRVQMMGVLREVVAQDRAERARDGRGGRATGSASSLLFESPAIATDRLDWQTLPALRVDPSDPHAGWLAGLEGLRPLERLEALAGAPTPPSPEVRLETCRTALVAGRPDVVDATADQLLREDPWEWRAVWMQGLAALARGDWAAAQSAFNAVYGQVPGELAPKLALALACEASGESDVAMGLYAACARTDLGYTPAGAFGLARLRARAGDLRGAVLALDLVPSTSGAHALARQTRADLLAQPGAGLDALAAARASVEGVVMEPADRARLDVRIYDNGLRAVVERGEDPALRIGPHPATAKSMRLALEDALRRLASLTPDKQERVRLVDQANTVRPWSLR